MGSKAKALIYFGAGVAVAVATDTLLASSLPWIAELMIPLAGLTTMALDLTDRWRAKYPAGVERFFSLSCGGSIRFAPVWGLGAFLAVIGFVGVLLRL